MTAQTSPTNTMSFKRLEQFAEALALAIYDRELEDSGVEIKWYADADVVIPYMRPATALIDELPSGEHSVSEVGIRLEEGIWSYFRVLAGCGLMPKLELLWPHRIEMNRYIRKHQRVLSDVAELQATPQDVATHLGSLVAAQHARQSSQIPTTAPDNFSATVVSLKQAIDSRNVEEARDTLVSIAERLPIHGFAILEAFARPNWYQRLKVLLGEDARENLEVSDATLSGFPTAPLQGIVEVMLRHIDPENSHRIETAPYDAAVLYLLDQMVPELSSTQRVRLITFTGSVGWTATDPRAKLRLADSNPKMIGVLGSAVRNERHGTLIRGSQYCVLRSNFSALRWRGVDSTGSPGTEQSDLGGFATIEDFKRLLQEIMDCLRMSRFDFFSPTSESSRLGHASSIDFDGRLSDDAIAIMSRVNGVMSAGVAGATWIERRETIALILARAMSMDREEVLKIADATRKQIQSSVSLLQRAAIHSLSAVMGATSTVYRKRASIRGAIETAAPLVSDRDSLRDAQAVLRRWYSKECVALRVGLEFLTELSQTRDELQYGQLAISISRRYYGADASMSAASGRELWSDRDIAIQVSRIIGLQTAAQVLGAWDLFPDHDNLPMSQSVRDEWRKATKLSNYFRKVGCGKWHEITSAAVIDAIEAVDKLLHSGEGLAGSVGRSSEAGAPWMWVTRASNLLNGAMVLAYWCNEAIETEEGISSRVLNATRYGVSCVDGCLSAPGAGDPGFVIDAMALKVWLLATMSINFVEHNQLDPIDLRNALEGLSDCLRKSERLPTDFAYVSYSWGERRLNALRVIAPAGPELPSLPTHSSLSRAIMSKFALRDPLIARTLSRLDL